MSGEVRIYEEERRAEEDKCYGHCPLRLERGRRSGAERVHLRQWTKPDLEREKRGQGFIQFRLLFVYFRSIHISVTNTVVTIKLKVADVVFRWDSNCRIVGDDISTDPDSTTFKIIIGHLLCKALTIISTFLPVSLYVYSNIKYVIRGTLSNQRTIVLKCQIYFNQRPIFENLWICN